MSYGLGSFPSICFHQGSLWLVLQDFAQLRLYRDGAKVQEIPLSDRASGFPQLASMNGLWLAFRDGATGRLLKVENGETVDFGKPGGNSPHLLSDGFIYWQQDGGCWKAPVTNPAQPVKVNSRVTPTGLVGISNGQPLYWDDVAGSQPRMILSAFAGSLVAGEGHHGGSLVRDRATKREKVFWPGQERFKPAIAQSGERCAVASWSNREGVLVASFTLADLQPVTTPAPVPPKPNPSNPPPDPEPTPMPAQIPNQRHVVERIRAKYPSGPMTKTQQAAFLLELAREIGEIPGAGRAGLHLKGGSNSYPVPGGKSVDGDLILFEDGHMFDVLGSEETKSTPTWTDEGISSKAGQIESIYYLVPPAGGDDPDPGDENDGDDNPPSEPTQPTCNCAAELADIRRKLDAIEQAQDMTDSVALNLARELAAVKEQVEDQGDVQPGSFDPKRFYAEGSLGVSAVLRNDTVQWQIKERK